MALRVLAVDDNAINLKVVSITLQHNGYEVFTADNGVKALELANTIQPDMILLDITMPEMDGYEVCRRLRSNVATALIPIVMLTAHDTLEEKIKGFEAGADDYLTKPFQPAELIARMKVLVRRVSSAPVKEDKSATPARVISVFSLRGGVGVTSIAVNLACGLAQLWGKQVALVDLATTMGQAALMLNLPLRNTWADLINIPVRDLDGEVVQRAMIQHASGVHVLAAPRNVEDGEKISPELVQKVLEILKRQYRYVVIDLPHDFRENTMLGLEASERVVGLLSPELASVRAMNGALEVFDKLGYQRENILIGINWIFEKRGLARKDIEGVLGQNVNVMFPFSAEVMVSAINLGAPPVLNPVVSPIASVFEDLAYFLSREDDLRNRPSNPSEMLKRALERNAPPSTNKR